MSFRPFILVFAALALAPACAEERYGAVYDADADAAGQIDAALRQAAAQDKQVLLLFGANWCHDSRGLAHRLMTDRLLAPLVEDHYVFTPVDIGVRHRNLDQLQRFGVAAAYGAPTLVIADADGGLINTDTVHDWRASDDAGVEDVAAYLAVHAAAPAPIEGAVATVDIAAAAESCTSLSEAMTDGSDPELAAYAAGLAVSEDVTETVLARLNRIEQDIAERRARERDETADAREAG